MNEILKSFTSFVLGLLLIVSASPALAASSLGDFDHGLGPWQFGKGSEYPGAQGEALPDSDAHRGRSALRIRGDFTGGGRYVHITRKLEPAVDAGPVTFWVKTAGVKYLLVRLVDETGQTFQPRVSLKDEAGWQRVMIRQLNSGQHWGGANDNTWHGKLTGVSVLLEKQAIDGDPQAKVLIDDIMIGAGTAEEGDDAAEPAGTTRASLGPVDASALQDGFESGDEGWVVGLGTEFPGAQGGQDRTDLAAHEGATSIRLWGDFTEGGRYVGTTRNYDPHVPATGLSLWVKPHDAKYILVRLVDSTGQNFQHQIPVEPNDSWQKVALDDFRSRTKWGGANDGQWHGPLTRASVMLEKQSIVGGAAMAWLHLDDFQIQLQSDAEVETAVSFPAPLGTFGDSSSGWWPHQDSRVSVEFGVDSTQGHAAAGALRADIDYSHGGNWFTLIRQLDQPFVIDTLRFWIKPTNVRELNVQVLGVPGQQVSRQVGVTPGRWQLVELSDLPVGPEKVSARDGKLFGAQVAIRVGVDRAQLADPNRARATLLIDDAEAVVSGKGVLYAPGSAMRGTSEGVARIDLPRSVPIFWGPQDRPGDVTVRFFNPTNRPMTTAPVRLLDHALRPVRTLDAGGQNIAPGQSTSQTYSLQLPAFGQYTVETHVAGEPVRGRIAWVAEEGKPDPEGKLGLHHHMSQGPWGRSQYVGGGEAAIEITRKIGFGWIREDFKGEFNDNDEIRDLRRHGFFGWADAAHESGMNILGIYFDYFNNGQPPSDEVSRRRYAQRFAKLVDAYRDVMQYFEVWNEPNIAPGWRGRTPDAEEYTAMLKRAYAAIKDTYPGATVVGVTSAGTDFRFIEDVLKAGGAQYMDALSFHPYHPYVAPERHNPLSGQGPVALGSGDEETFVSRVQTIESLMDRYGMAGKAMFGTEMGSGFKDDNREWRDTLWLTRQHLLGMAIEDLRMQATYNFQDQGYNEVEASHMTFGLVRADGSPEPRLVAMNTLARVLYKKRFEESIDLGEGVYAYRMTGHGGDTLAIWTVDEGRTVAFHTAKSAVTVMDLMGNTREVEPVDGQVTIAATGEPVFVLDAGAVSPGQPILQISAPEQATSEDRVVVTIAGADLLGSSAVSGSAGPGWDVVEATPQQVVFQADPALPSGRHTLKVRVGDMTAATDLTIENALVLTARPNTSGNLVVNVDNPFPQARQVNLRPVVPGQRISPQTLTAPGAGHGEIVLDVETTTSAGLRTVPVSLNAELDKSRAGYIALPAQGDRFVAGATPWRRITPRIDGRIDEWPADQAAVLNQAYQAVPIGRFAKPTWEGPQDLSGRFWVGSDADRLYLAVQSRDDRHVQPFKPDEMWKGDSIQFAMLVDGTRYEFTIGVTDSGQVVVRQDSPMKAIVRGAAGQSRPSGEGQVLEVALPWQAIGLADHARAPSNFALLINDNDHADNGPQGGRKGYIEWFSGIGGEKKDPAFYGPVRPIQ